MSWLHFPEISTGDFDSAPDQLNSSEPQGIEDLQVTEIGHATGRIVLCTDGMAEYMLRRGIDEVLEGVLSNDPEVSLDKLRNDGIAEDDLSMVALHSNKTRDFKKRGERIRMGGKGGEVNT